MVARYVLDSSALLAYLDDTHSAAKVEELLVRAQAETVAVHMSAVNWGEVFYQPARLRSASATEEARRLVRRFPIQIAMVDAARAEKGAAIKIQSKLHYSDCFAAALAQELKATIVTSDADFKRVQGQLKIMWLAAGRKR